ncbi:hypothetical protein TRVL_05835 [Trypanosoma vivax]|nr:hypothetical protein TRVL_05835 [Trypanosoma vivax]
MISSPPLSQAPVSEGVSEYSLVGRPSQLRGDEGLVTSGTGLFLYEHLRRPTPSPHNQRCVSGKGVGELLHIICKCTVGRSEITCPTIRAVFHYCHSTRDTGQWLHDVHSSHCMQ